MEPERGETLADALFHWAGTITLLPAVVITAPTLTPWIRNSFKRAKAPAMPPQHVGYPHQF